MMHKIADVMSSLMYPNDYGEWVLPKDKSLEELAGAAFNASLDRAIDTVLWARKSGYCAVEQLQSLKAGGSVSDGSREAGKTGTGLIEDDSAVTAGQTPSPISPLLKEGAVEEMMPVAFVPIHPRNGALWAETFSTGEDVSERRSSFYPLEPLYGKALLQTLSSDLAEREKERDKAQVERSKYAELATKRRLWLERAQSQLAEKDREMERLKAERDEAKRQEALCRADGNVQIGLRKSAEASLSTLKTRLEEVEGALSEAKTVMEMEPWWHDPEDALYPLRFKIEGALYPACYSISQKGGGK